jgi:hypothetical protein
MPHSRSSKHAIFSSVSHKILKDARPPQAIL